MQIKVIEEGKKRFSLCIPTWLGFNHFTALFAPLFLRKSGIKIKVKTAWNFVTAFYKVRRHFGGKLDFVDVEASDGTVVKITL